MTRFANAFLLAIALSLYVIGADPTVDFVELLR